MSIRERRQIRKVSLIGRDLLGSRSRRGERQSEGQRSDFDHVQTNIRHVAGVHVRPRLHAVLRVLQHVHECARPKFFDQSPAVLQECWLDLVPFRRLIRAVRGFGQNCPMLALFGHTPVPVGRELHFPPRLVGNVLSDFENGRKKGEFGRWILHELSRSRCCSQHAQQRDKAAGLPNGVAGEHMHKRDPISCAQDFEPAARACALGACPRPNALRFYTFTA